MVLTRRQRKSGINVTPTQPETKIKKTRNKLASEINVREEEILSSDLPLALKEDEDKSRRTKNERNSLQRKTFTENQPDDNEDEICTHDSNTKQLNLYENVMVVDNKISSDTEKEMELKTLQQLKENSDIIFRDNDLESSGDEAPEAVAFVVARETALETLHQAYNQSIQIKSKKKEKRRAHDAMMKEQAQKKMKRCEELDSNRLPDTFLAKVNTGTTESHSTPQKPETDKINADDEYYTDEDDDNNYDDEDVDELFKNGDDYMIEKDGFQIVPLQKFAKTPVVKSMAASNFRQEQLYGKRIPRVSAPKQISMSLKRASKPAMNFKVKGIAVTKKERRQKKNSWSNLIR